MVIMFFHSINTCPLETGLKPADSSDDFQSLQGWAVFKSVTQNKKLSPADPGVASCPRLCHQKQRVGAGYCWDGEDCRGTEDAVL